MIDSTVKVDGSVKRFIDSTVKVDQDIKTFNKLIDETMFAVSASETEKKFEIDNKWSLLSLIDNGYKIFPSVYQTSFLDPLKKLIETKVFADILNAYNSDGDSVLGDWVSCIDQRIIKKDSKETSELLNSTTMAFTELCSDIYDGYVSKSVRKDANLPEYQIYAPITRWGGGDAFTHSVRAGTSLGIQAAVVSIPKAWSNNIALWSLCVHECYHDVIDAYKGLLNEVEDLISDVFESDEIKEDFTEEMNWNGEKCSEIPRFAAEYWRRTMSETLPDICSLLNIGPSAGISFALLALAKKGQTLTPSSNIELQHPDNVLRIIIAREVTQRLLGLDIKVRNGYIEFFNKIIEDYVYEKDNFILFTLVRENKNPDYIIPFESMIKTIKIVVEKVAFTRLKSLGNHSLAEINTWKNPDEILVQEIMENLLRNKKTNIDSRSDGSKVYAAHIVAAATLALIKNPDPSSITKLAVESLKQLYDSNPIWRGFPATYRSDIENKDMILPN
jgi:hypothetical protein